MSTFSRGFIKVSNSVYINAQSVASIKHVIEKQKFVIETLPQISGSLLMGSGGVNSYFTEYEIQKNNNPNLYDEYYKYFATNEIQKNNNPNLYDEYYKYFATNE
jgi:hypothetical protein